MNDQPAANRSRRPSRSRRKAPQFNTAKTRGKGPVAQKGQGRGKDSLAGRGGGRVRQRPEGGPVVVAFVRPMHDPETGREWERVFLFEVEAPEEIDAAEAWLEENYPPSKGVEQ